MLKNKIYEIPENVFIEVIKNAKNMSCALKIFNIMQKAFYYKSLKQRCKELNLELNFKQSPEILIRKQLTDSEIIIACKNNISRQSALKSLNLSYTGASINWIRKKITQLHIDTSHWLGQGYLRGKAHNWSNKIPIQEFLVNDKPGTNNVALKKRLIKEGLLIYKCYKCGIENWCNEKITLQIHHINGISNDNTLKNLQLLCPNCHSQTHNFCGKNCKKNKSHKHKILNSKSKKQYFCPKCNKIQNKNRLCRACYNKTLEIINWPTNEELLNMISQFSYLEVAKLLGVSDAAIRKRLRIRGIDPPKKQKSH